MVGEEKKGNYGSADVLCPLYESYCNETLVRDLATAIYTLMRFQASFTASYNLVSSFDPNVCWKPLYSHIPRYPSSYTAPQYVYTTPPHSA